MGSDDNSPVQEHVVPISFVNRRLHSLAGFFLILFLMEHLLTNSQAALWLGEDGAGFIHAVNLLHSLPYLQVLEIMLIGVPVAIHGYLGVVYLYDGAVHLWSRGGRSPALPFARNYAYVLQRLTSIIVVIGIIAHVITMRVMRYPETVRYSTHNQYAVRVFPDPGLMRVAPRLRSTVVSENSKPLLITENAKRESVARTLLQRAEPPYKIQRIMELRDTQATKERLRNWDVSQSSCVVVAPDFGTAALFVVRDTMRRPWICVLYTLFVLAACFHAANGLWTFAISWGFSIKERGRQYVRYISYFLLLALAGCGLASIWLTYWYNLFT